MLSILPLRVCRRKSFALQTSPEHRIANKRAEHGLQGVGTQFVTLVRCQPTTKPARAGPVTDYARANHFSQGHRSRNIDGRHSYGHQRDGFLSGKGNADNRQCAVVHGVPPIPPRRFFFRSMPRKSRQRGGVVYLMGVKAIPSRKPARQCAEVISFRTICCREGRPRDQYARLLPTHQRRRPRGVRPPAGTLWRWAETPTDSARTCPWATPPDTVGDATVTGSAA